jgi:hypothetical protein
MCLHMGPFVHANDRGNDPIDNGEINTHSLTTTSAFSTTERKAKYYSAIGVKRESVYSEFGKNKLHNETNCQPKKAECR